MGELLPDSFYHSTTRGAVAKTIKYTKYPIAKMVHAVDTAQSSCNVSLLGSANALLEYHIFAGLFQRLSALANLIILG